MNVPDVLKLFHSHSGMDNPDVVKLFHRHSVWMIRISVLVKVNGICHYSFIDLIYYINQIYVIKLASLSELFMTETW
jgi:hypothetical protein